MGDEVVILDPLYQQSYSIAEVLGCDIHRWSRTFSMALSRGLDDALRLM